MIGNEMPVLRVTYYLAPWKPKRKLKNPTADLDGNLRRRRCSNGKVVSGVIFA
jgi:hypothetical protein